MSAPVQLYVYDLSNGLARQMSRQLTGRQIDGIWHTSVVVFGREVFYGQGIMTTAPGRSHHGSPLRTVDMGQTSLDEATWNEYLDDMRDHYTADKYHLLDFNCNSFTNDCVGFLTGASIPDFIKDLPTDFLSTPFGAALRPTIDAMFRPPSSTPARPTQAVRPDPNPQLTASLLQAIANQPALPGLPSPTSTHSQPSRGSSTPATQSLTGHIHLSTNPSSFNNLLRTHKAVVAYFTQQNCPPCRVIEPIFERLANDNKRPGLAFTKIDIGVGLGSSVAQEWSVRATPTFMFFLDGKKVAEMKGADANELRTQVDLLVWQAWPPHPHTSISSRALDAISLNPILFTQSPNLDALMNKFASFIDAAAASPDSAARDVKGVLDAKAVLVGRVIPYLKARSALLKVNGAQNGNGAVIAKVKIDESMLLAWASATTTLTKVLPMEELFPLVDMWRLVFLDPRVGVFWSMRNDNPVTTLLGKVKVGGENAKTRNYILILLRLLANAFSSPEFSRVMMSGVGMRAGWTEVVVGCLLHEDGGVRTAAASLAFNAGVWGFKQRVGSGVGKGSGRGVGKGDKREGGGGGGGEGEEDGEWEVEMVSAVVEAVDRENENEDVVHRLVACLASLLRLSPFHEQLGGLLEVLQAREVLRRKLGGGAGGEGKGKGGVKKEEVRALIRDVADKLCS